MGNFSRPGTVYLGSTFNSEKHYSGVRFQQGICILDTDVNEMADITRHELREFLKAFLGDGVPQGSDVFKIKIIEDQLLLSSPAAPISINLEKSTAAAALGFGTENQTGIALLGTTHAPFKLANDMILAGSFGDALFSITFKTTDFVNIAQATIVEVAKVIKAGYNGLQAQAAASNTSGFYITAGTDNKTCYCLVDGRSVWHEKKPDKPNLTYTTQDLYIHKEKAPLWGVPELLPWTQPTTSRLDIVYLDVWEREVSEAEDTSLKNEDIHIPLTCTRLKREWVVRIAEGITSLGNPPSGHSHYKLAYLQLLPGGRIDSLLDLRTNYGMFRGERTSATGMYALAAGRDTTAKGAYSLALGTESSASGDVSFALGNKTTASNLHSFALGGYTTASGHTSFALGMQTTASNNYAFAMGCGTTASGSSSFAMGNRTTASGSSSFALGDGTIASNFTAFALGRSTTASGQYSFALGDSTTASGSTSFAFGNNAKANGLCAIAMGMRSSASADNAVALGIGATAAHKNTFVWSDGSLINGQGLTSTAENQFLIRASGGVGIDINTNINDYQLNVVGSKGSVRLGTNNERPGFDQQLKVEGSAYISKGVTGPGRDYAEYFEAADGKEIPIGTSVMLEEGKIRPATSGKQPFGVISAGAMLVGGIQTEWADKYLKDAFGRVRQETYQEEVKVPKKHKVMREKQKVLKKTISETVMRTEVVFENGKYLRKTIAEPVTREVEEPLFEEVDLYDETGQMVIGKHRIPVMEQEECEEEVLDGNGQRVLECTGEFITKTRPLLNPTYEEGREYIPRQQRPEWNCVGLLGQIPVRKGQPVAKAWVKLRELSDEADLWLVK